MGDKRSWQLPILLLPALGFLAMFFAYPLLDLSLRSVAGPSGLTAGYYQQVLGRPVYHQTLWITVQIAFAVTTLTLAIGYPLAYVLREAPPRLSLALMSVVLLPFFTSLVVRSYAWMVILAPEGPLNRLLGLVGVGAVSLLYNRAGVLVGMVYALLPYMVLALYGTIRSIDPNLLRAARASGANDWQTFRRVFFPLSLPGVASGSLLVFLLSLGYFVTPRLLGGERDQMVGTVIEYQVELLLNWPLASALSVLLLITTAVGFALCARLIRWRTLLEGRFTRE